MCVFVCVSVCECVCMCVRVCACMHACVERFGYVLCLINGVWRGISKAAAEAMTAYVDVC